MTARPLGLNLRDIKESLIALVIGTVAAIFAGIFLGKAEELLLILPGLIILIPGALNTRGAIFAALGSRLSSGMHLGVITKFYIKNMAVTKNIYATTTLNISLSIILGIFAWVISYFLNIHSISVFHFIFISVIGGVLSGLILLFITFAISFKSYKRGWDPDNITSPIITTSGDLITVPSIIFAGVAALYLPFIEVISALIIIIVLIEFVLLFVLNRRHKEIVKQSFFILLISGFLSSLAGVFVQVNLHYFIAFPILLVIFPAFIAIGGNIGNIFAARTSTRLHLGLKGGFLSNFKIEGLSSYILCIIIFPFISLVAFLATNHVSIIATEFFMTTVFIAISGIIVTAFVLVVSSIMAYFSYRFDLDPDNVIIPIVTGSADFIGIIVLISVLHGFGFV
ncbi:magnesium transporter [Candidatus Aenigmatarchaeota archaeon]